MTQTKHAIVSRSAYFALAALFTMNLLNYIDRNILAAVIEPVQKDLGIADADDLAGLLATIFFASYSLFSPVTGWLGDRMTRKYLLAVGVGVWSVATFASGMVTTFWQMVLARSVLGIGEATYATIAPALIADFFPREKRNRALAVFYLAIPVGSALGFVIGGFVEAHWGWQQAFFVVGYPGLAVAFLALVIREPQRGASEAIDEAERVRHEALPTSWGAYAALGRNPSFVLNTLGMAMMTFTVGGLAFWTPKFLSTVRGMARQDASFWLGVAIVVSGLVGTAVGSIAADKLARKVRGAYFWIGGISMWGAVPFVCAALVAKQPVIIFLCMTLGLTLIFLNTGPSNTIIVNVTMPKIRAAAFAVNILFIHLLGDIPSPYVMGGVTRMSTSMFWGMAVTIPAMLASGLFYSLGAKHYERDQQAVLDQLHAARNDVLAVGVAKP